MSTNLHVPVLHEQFRAATDHKTGLVPVRDALNGYRPDIFRHASNSLWLGDEFPLYEVALDGAVYRMLIRVRAGQSNVYEVIRCIAPALKADGHLLPAPDAIPNTPIALVNEIASLVGLSVAYVAERGYSIMDYRKVYGAKYPDSMTPAQFRLREWMLLVGSGEDFSSLYDTPKGANPELWTLFLKILDNREAERVFDYVASGAAREFNPSTVALMKTALRMRNGHDYTARTTAPRGLIATFPLAEGQMQIRRTGPQTKAISRGTLSISFSY